MAHHVQRLIGWLALGTAVFGQPFSHKKHLDMGIACASCHQTVQDSTHASDNNLPTFGAACQTCHDGETRAVKAPRALTVHKFNHQLHLKMGNVAPVLARAMDAKTYLQNHLASAPEIRRQLANADQCGACHRGVAANEAVSTAMFPQMADCLVCHNKIENPYSCEKCHDKDQALKPASHTADWMDRHNAAKTQIVKQDCHVCHGQKFTCLGCH